MSPLSDAARHQAHEASLGIQGFARHVIGIRLHPYQQKAAAAIVRSVFRRDGMSFVLIFPRQSGKDETLAVLFLFLMVRFMEIGIDIVCAQPTFKPQTVNAMERLMKRGANLGERLTRSAGYIFRLGMARTCFFSADASASQVGATADRLLVMNEAQDISPALYDKRFAPMAASGNATRLFSGTAWTSSTLLGREKRLALDAERNDGRRRVFQVDCEAVGAVNPHYRRHVQAEIRKLGRDHPIIRSQYFCEEIDAQGGMFTPARRLLMQGDEPPVLSPEALPRAPLRALAFLLDVAGQDETLMSRDESAPLTNPGRDSAALTIVSIDLSTLATLQAPTYRFIHRMQWIGENHLRLFGVLKSLVGSWQPQQLIMDATGVGEGLWALLAKAFPSRVRAVKFSQQVKSELGWRYLAIVETGRLRDCCPSDRARAQYAACRAEVLPGPSRSLRWGVPEGARDADGELIHDDILMADALVAELDRLDWSLPTAACTVNTPDPLKGMEGNY